MNLLREKGKTDNIKIFRDCNILLSIVEDLGRRSKRKEKTITTQPNI